MTRNVTNSRIRRSKMSTRIYGIIDICGGLLLASMLPVAAIALPQTWVASTGGGTACSRGSPCATFQAAQNATDANGQVSCVDAADYGPVTLTKSITIDCSDVGATISVAAGDAITTGPVNLVVT